MKRINYEALAWNCIMYMFSVLLTVLLIQHAVFFYSFPPDWGRWIDVVPVIYVVLGGGVYFLLKFAHIVEEKGEILFMGEEGDDE